MKVAVIGRTGNLLRAAREILSCGHEIPFVYTCRSEEFYEAKEKDFSDLAQECGAVFFNDLNINEKAELLLDFNCDIAISINWLTLLKQQVLDVFPFGVLNAHAGDLPRYRGNACPNWAILNGEKQIALTIHQMSVDLDSGPVILKKYMELQPNTYIGDVSNWLKKMAPEMMV